MAFRDIIKRLKTKKDKLNGKTEDTGLVVAQKSGTGNSISAQSQTVPPTQEAMDKEKVSELITRIRSKSYTRSPNKLFIMLTSPSCVLSKLITKEEPCDSNGKELVASELHLDLSEALGLCFVRVAYRDGYRTSFIDGPLHTNTIGAYRAMLDHLEVRMWKDEPWFTTDQHERMVQSQTFWDRFGVQWDQLSVVEDWLMPGMNRSSSLKAMRHSHSTIS